MTGLLFFKGNNKFLHNCKILNVNKIESASTEDKERYYFLYMQHSTDIFFGTVLCEFSVYRQEGRETEMITQFCVRTELGASHD